MTQGVGQFSAQFASPDFPLGAADMAATNGATLLDYSNGTGTSAQLPSTVHANMGNEEEGPAGRASSWRNLFDTKSPLFWLMLFTLFYFGIIALGVHFRLGRVRGGADFS